MARAGSGLLGIGDGAARCALESGCLFCMCKQGCVHSQQCLVHNLKMNCDTRLLDGGLSWHPVFMNNGTFTHNKANTLQSATTD